VSHRRVVAESVMALMAAIWEGVAEERIGEVSSIVEMMVRSLLEGREEGEGRRREGFCSRSERVMRWMVWLEGKRVWREVVRVVLKGMLEECSTWFFLVSR